MPVTVNIPSVPQAFVVSYPVAVVVPNKPNNRYGIKVSPTGPYSTHQIAPAISLARCGTYGGQASSAYITIGPAEARVLAAALIGGSSARVSTPAGVLDAHFSEMFGGDVILTPAANGLAVVLQNGRRPAGTRTIAAAPVFDPAAAHELARVLRNAADVADGKRSAALPL